MHDLSPQLDDLPECGLQVSDWQVGQREAVARTTAALVEPNSRAGVLSLQALALLRLALGELDVYAHMFERARHADDLRERIGASSLAAAVGGSR